MRSNYSRDPRVPPVHVEHLGKRRPSPASGEQDHAEATAEAIDAGPSYQDFLVHERPAVDLQGETG
jgi:hypothetical protein